jgi:hypothetical protein
MSRLLKRAKGLEPSTFTLATLPAIPTNVPTNSALKTPDDEPRRKCAENSGLTADPLTEILKNSEHLERLINALEAVARPKRSSEPVAPPQEELD